MPVKPSIPLTYWCENHFSEPVQDLRMHPEEFCESVNLKIAPLTNLRNRLIARVLGAALACIFCAAAAVYYTHYLGFSLSKRKSRIYYIHYFDSSSLVGKIGLGFLSCVAAILTVRAVATYLRYSEQYQMIEGDMKQYRSSFLFKTASENPISQEIFRFLPEKFKSYQSRIKTQEWKMEGGKKVDGIFTELKATEIKDLTEVNDDSESWLDLLTFVVQEPQISELTKRELVREVFPLVDPSHNLRFLVLPDPQPKEGEVFFRRSYSEEKQAQEIIAYTQNSEIHYSKADDLKDFLISHYQISLSNSQGPLSNGKDEEELKDSPREHYPISPGNSPVSLDGEGEGDLKNPLIEDPISQIDSFELLSDGGEEDSFL